MLLCGKAHGAAAFKALVFSKTATFRHASIPDGITAIRRLGTNNNFDVVATENAADFNDANLSQFAAVIFLSTTGDVLDETQQSAFERYIRADGGYVGIHAASDTEYNWPWYGGLVGAYFSSHPAIQNAIILTEDFEHPSTHFLPESWLRNDEWYNFRTNPRSSVHVLARLDESSYSGGAMGADHPIAWYHAYDGGRAWYTAGGHTAQSYNEPLFLTHLLGGIRYAANVISNPTPGAMVLFNGREASHWTSITNGTGMPWQVTNGVLTVLPGTGRIRTVQPFEDYLLHLEFAVPPSPPGTAEGSLANTGVYLQDQFEIQIMDSYGRAISGANETGAIWGQRDPSTNAARPTGTWETLDIEFRAARWKNSSVKLENARVSIWWNGVLVQDNVEIANPTDGGSPPEIPPPGAIRLQDLVGAVQFRNIWLLPREVAPEGKPLRFVLPGSTWRYLDDGSAPPSNWSSNSFVAASWPIGRAQLGYGDSDEATIIRSNRLDNTRIMTTYFRKIFSVTNTTFLTNVELRVLRDDGVIAYLNGTEIFRNNMPAGAVNSATTANNVIANAQELHWISTNINPGLLWEGENVLAVEVHQSSATSTDLSFDLALSGLAYDRPAISAQRTLENVTFSWPALPPGFSPEVANDLANPAWGVPVNPVTTVPGVRSSVTFTNGGGDNLFLRLRQNSVAGTAAANSEERER